MISKKNAHVVLESLRNHAKSSSEALNLPITDFASHQIADLIEDLINDAANVKKDKWLTIDSAPKDGTWLIVCYPDVRTSIFGHKKRRTPRIEIARWDCDLQNWYDSHSLRGFEHPTHWMPMPLLPERINI